MASSPDLIRRGAQSRERLCTLIASCYETHRGNDRIVDTVTTLSLNTSVVALRTGLRATGCPDPPAKEAPYLTHVLSLIRSIPILEEKSKGTAQPDVRDTAKTLLSFAHTAEEALLAVATTLTEDPARRDLLVTHERIMRLGDDARKNARTILRPSVAEQKTQPAYADGRRRVSDRLPGRNGRRKSQSRQRIHPTRMSPPLSPTPLPPATPFPVPRQRPTDEEISRWEERQQELDGMTHSERVLHFTRLFALRKDATRLKEYMDRLGITMHDVYRWNDQYHSSLLEHPDILAQAQARLASAPPVPAQSTPPLPEEDEGDDPEEEEWDESEEGKEEKNEEEDEEEEQNEQRTLEGIEDLVFAPIVCVRDAMENIFRRHDGDALQCGQIETRRVGVLTSMRDLTPEEAEELRSMLCIPCSVRSPSDRARVRALIRKQRPLLPQSKEANAFLALLLTEASERSTEQEQELLDLAMELYGS